MFVKFIPRKIGFWAPGKNQTSLTGYQNDVGLIPIWGSEIYFLKNVLDECSFTFCHISKLPHAWKW